MPGDIREHLQFPVCEALGVESLPLLGDILQDEEVPDSLSKVTGNNDEGDLDKPAFSSTSIVTRATGKAEPEDRIPLEERSHWHRG